MKQKTLVGDGSRISTLCLKQYSAFERKRITYNELEKELVYISLVENLPDLAYRENKAKMPDILEAYYKTPETLRKPEASFWKQPDIVAYKQKQDDIDSENASNFDWLRHMVSILAIGKDQANIEKVVKIMRTYPDDKRDMLVKFWRKHKGAAHV